MCPTRHALLMGVFDAAALLMVVVRQPAKDIRSPRNSRRKVRLAVADVWPSNLPILASPRPKSESTLGHRWTLLRGPTRGREATMRLRVIFLGLLIAGASNCFAQKPYVLRDGDIVFQESRSAQSAAIQRATGSRYSHMGMIYRKAGEFFVFEAVEPVKSTPFDEWIAKGTGRHFVVKRLSRADELLTPQALQKMLGVGRTFEGKHYDLRFEWSDDRIYCSELVWKIYNRALGLEIGDLETMGDLNVSDPAVDEKIRERWGRLPSSDQIVISPAAMYSSDLLITIHRE